MSVTPEPLPLLFGPFALDRTRRLLRRGASPVPLGGRALDLLVLLVERAPSFVSREELVAHAWPRTIVEETSLRVHMSALRRALGDGAGDARYIVNAPGRGYCFVAEVSERQGDLPVVVARPDCTGPAHNLPGRVGPVFGRADILSTLVRSLDRRRLVSIVGPGGMGKTTVALAVARARLQCFEDGVWFVDLAPLSDPARVPAALAAALGIAISLNNPVAALQAYLRESEVLIVLDNCEHVIDSAAHLAEALLKAAARAKILVTSREPLEVEGEWVHRLAALAVPEPRELLSTTEAISFSAIQLFVERASANADDFALSDRNLPIVRQLCRRLDGMPLAIELAAARVGSLGVRGVATRLNDVFQLLVRGRRTALPRHQTLMALLDWSHSLLGEPERIVLRRLALFRTSFTLDAACRICSDDKLSVAIVTESLSSLISRSLVSADIGQQTAQYRLLYTTRAYATDKLLVSGDGESVARRHALYFQDLLERASLELEHTAISEWLGRYAVATDDLLAGMAWAFGPTGDNLVGISLAAAALDLMHELGAWELYRPWVELSLERMRAMDVEHPEHELKLCSALCCMSGIMLSPANQIDSLRTRTLVLVESEPVQRQQIEALFNLCVSAFGRGEYHLTRAIASRIREIAADPASALSVLLADRFLALSRHYLGEHGAASEDVRRVLAFPAMLANRRYYRQILPSVSMNVLRARMLWLQGDAHQAAVVAAEAVRHAEGSDSYGLCQALAMGAIPIALWCGEERRAAILCQRLAAVTQRFSQSYWTEWIVGFEQVLALRGEKAAPTDPLEEAPVRRFSNVMLADLLGTLDMSLLTPESAARADRGDVGWCAPEFSRVQAERLLTLDAPGAQDEALALLESSLALARSQEALAWELRTSTSIARLHAIRGRADDARQLLSAVTSRFDHGIDTIDLTEARRDLALISCNVPHVARRLHG